MVDEKQPKNTKAVEIPNATTTTDAPNNSAKKEPSEAKKRWQSAVGKIISEIKSAQLSQLRTQALQIDDDIVHHHDHGGLIEEIKKSNQDSKAKEKESVLSILKTQADLTKKVFERQKYSAKEILNQKRHVKSLDDIKGEGAGQISYTEFEHLAQRLYKITPEIQTKLDKIKATNEAEAKKEEEKGGKQGFFQRLLNASILGQTLMANPRFYKMDPHEHLPELCRRCRRPLVNTLESRFTSIGILFCIFLPIIGIPLLFANREFACVICEELYVYGDLTARPEEDEEED